MNNNINEDIQFLVMVDTGKYREDVLQLILDGFPDALRRKSNSCDLRDNWIEVWKNESADSDLAQDKERGYLYYKWRVEATPIGGHIIHEMDQISLAKDLLSCFEKVGCKAVVCANFEDKL